MSADPTTGTVAILLATHNGAQFLDEQIDSLERQSHAAIDIYVSDDGSTDATLERLEAWRQRWSKGKFQIVSGPGRGFAENFRSLLARPDIAADYCAFCDQDDLWEPEKLSHAIRWMQDSPDLPRLFCSRTRLVGEDGHTMGHSALFLRPPSFANALVQSIAGGNTMVFNRAAHRILRQASERSRFISHDWWAYIIVAGAGGLVRYDREPWVRYRQHRLNAVGANTTIAARYSRLKRLLRGQFSTWTEVNLRGLEANLDLLTPQTRRILDDFQGARRGSFVSRLRSLAASGVYRQSPFGDLALYLAVLVGRL